MDTHSLFFPSNLELKPPGLEPCWVTPSRSLLPSLNHLYLNRLSSLASTSAESEDSESCSDSSTSPNFASLLPGPSPQELLRSPLPPPPGLTMSPYTESEPRCQLPVQPKPKPMPKLKSFNFAVVFQGYDLTKHADFELVPRLIGRRGCNMAPIYNTGAGARVRGRGSGYKEVRTPHGDYERDETLQLAVSCRSSLGYKIATLYCSFETCFFRQLLCF